MALALFVIGAMMIITGVRGTAGAFYSQLWNDVDSQFIYWLIAFAIVGLIGQAAALKTPATWFMLLMLITMALTYKDAIPNFEKTFNITPKG